MKATHETMLRIAFGLACLLVVEASFAGIASPGANTLGAVFADFRNTVVGWARGPQGVAISVMTMLGGTLIGVVRNSPKPVLAGCAVAAVLGLGPDAIMYITEGALI